MKFEVTGFKSAGDKIEGTLLCLTGDQIHTHDLPSSVKDKILVAKFFTKAAILKAMVLEMAGLVTSQMSDELFEELGKPMDWEIGEPSVLKISFLIVDEQKQKDLKKHEGKKAKLNPEEKKLVIEN